MEGNKIAVLDSVKPGPTAVEHKHRAEEDVTSMAANAVGSLESKITSASPLESKVTSAVHCDSHFTKEIRSNGCSNSSILRSYSNFMRSGLPQLLMFYQNGEWVDVPEVIKDSVRESFRQKRAVTEMEFQGRHVMFDCLRMLHLDFELGIQVPIAWVDDSNAQFFPMFDNNCLKIKDSWDGLSSDMKGVCHIGLEVSADAETELEGVAENKPATVSSFLTNAFELTTLLRGNPEYDVVKSIFLMGSGTFICERDIEGIFRAPRLNDVVQKRKHAFHEQEHIVKRRRGNANVRYGWIAASSRDAAKDMVMHGLCCSEMLNPESGCSIGVCLTSVHSSNLSASLSDGDENGSHYMVLCRVILGSMGLVFPNSQQFHSCIKDFDSGVDNFEKPNHYVIGNTNAKSRIFPEYVVSFNMSRSVHDGNTKSGTSEVTSSDNECQWLGLPNDSVESGFQSSSTAKEPLQTGLPLSLTRFRQKLPTSPWMPFPMLFAAISDKIPREQMASVDRSYMEYLRKKISKMDLIKRLRMIVGDKLLKATIVGLQRNTRKAEGNSWREIVEGNQKMSI